MKTIGSKLRSRYITGIASAIGGSVSNYNGSISAAVTSVQSKEAHDFTQNTIKVLSVVKVDIYIPKYDPLINLTLKIIES